MSNPIVFISYSWSSPNHEQWVMDLATQLVKHGADVRLDKWDLREGQDAHAYMETMVSDHKVAKVIVVSDKKYSEKADQRKGGVGTESQIMSAEIYNKTDQTKFVAVIPEVDENGEPYLPRFFTSRVYILMTESHYATNFDQLLRWIYDKPLYTKPPLGTMPEFLKEDRAPSSTRAEAKRAVENLAGPSLARSPSAAGSRSLDSYLNSLASVFPSLYVDPNASDFPKAVLDNIEALLPYRNEFIEVMMTAAPSAGVELAKSLQRFFERIIPFMSRPETVNNYRTWDYDNFSFIVHELFLYAIAILLRFERFDIVNELIELRFFVPDDNRPNESMHPFTIVWKSMGTLQAKQQELRRTSLRADLLEQRSHASGLPFADLMVADFVLFLRRPRCLKNMTTGTQRRCCTRRFASDLRLKFLPGRSQKRILRSSPQSSV